MKNGLNKKIELDKNIHQLKKEFIRIRNLEYIKTIRSGNTGVGATFEHLLGKEQESFEIPDFDQIEIKTRRSYSKALISLFSAVPTGSSFYEVKRLRDTYGYRDPKEKSLKCLNTIIFGNQLTSVGIYYYFGLKIDREHQKVFLQIYDKQKNLIDENTYWDFDILEEKLFRKLSILALVKAWTNRIGGIEYFKYYKMNIYLLKGFSEFISMLENGKIAIEFRIGNYYSPKKFGMVHSHGVAFAIKEEDLEGLYEIYR